MPASYASRLPRPLPRVAGCAMLGACELFVADTLVDIRSSAWAWGPEVWLANVFAKTCLFAAAAFALVAWARRRQIADLWARTAADTTPAAALAVNILLFILLIAARAALQGAGETGGAPWALAYALLIVATGLSLAFVAAPLAFWRDLVRAAPSETAIAAGGALLVTLAGELSKQSWDGLSGATLHLSHAILTLFQPTAFMDEATHILGAGDFRVQVLADCSGYEGVALVGGFLALYLWAFRHALRFPNVLILLPAAMLAIWLLNALRIALLVAIGANGSPAIALGGFHSQAGWIAFLLVAFTAMAAAHRLPVFSVAASASSGRASPADDAPASPGTTTGNAALLYLAPFIALMAATVVASGFAPHEHAVYPLKVIAVAVPLVLMRHAYARFVSGASIEAAVVGAVIAVLWIATDPRADAGVPLGQWLATLPPALLAGWLALRGLGTVVLVPIAEELAFRGYLQRALQAGRFEDVDFKRLSWIAILASSALFGLMHERWLAAALAGIAYALLLVRSGRLADPIAAHMTTNAVIFLWALGAEQWSLL